MTTLFDHAREKKMRHEQPLAARMRPRTLEEYIGQEHILAPGRLLRRAIQAVCEGRDPGDLTTIEDPAALEQLQLALGITPS